MGINFYFLIPLLCTEDWKSYLLVTLTILHHWSVYTFISPYVLEVVGHTNFQM